MIGKYGEGGDLEEPDPKMSPPLSPYSQPGFTALLDITALLIFSIFLFLIFCIILIHVTNTINVLSSSSFFNL